MVGYRPKLIEVALPLAAINAEAAREKSIRHGHPSTLHLWWARRPLAAARAVIWTSLVDDPSGDELLTEEEQEVERERLFGILERLVKWESSNNLDVLAAARAEIDRCFPDGPPPILDPFAGGGAIPLEAQRLGLQALAGDLNPVAVLINRAMIEIPPRFTGRAPVNPEIDSTLTTWDRAQGLAADVEAYGRWMRDEAERRIGHLYPDVTGSKGEKLTPIAWIWARTVKSPDPAWSGHVPLVASWTLANAPDKPKVWIEPIIDRDAETISYAIREGGEPVYGRTVSRGNGTCIATGSVIPADYIKSEGCADRMGYQLIGVIAEGSGGRRYCEPTSCDRSAALCDVPQEVPSGRMSTHPQYMGTPRYGLDEWWKLFTARQLTALTTFSDLLPELWENVLDDAGRAGLATDGNRLRDGGFEATAYADAIVTYLAFAIDKSADYWSTLAVWAQQGFVAHTFGRQAIPMTWDFAESNPFSSSTGSWMGMVGWIRKVLNELPARSEGEVVQQDARSLVRMASNATLSTDPPYYDAVPYSDISDFFYVWLRRNLSSIWPDECATLLTPKSEELVADVFRFGTRHKAAAHFESGMAQFMLEVASQQPRDIPAVIYYAYKTTEQEGSTGWATFLQAVVDAGLQINSTWPMRTEKPGRLRANRSNALASSIVLACRPRPEAAALASRGEFVAVLREELPESVRVLQSGNIAPVDMAQATIGPGMRVFSRYARVVEADGSNMSVSSALAIINDVLGEILDGAEAELDAESRFALTWFSEHGFNPGASGDADNLARAKNTALSGIEEAGIGEARAGEFRLYERSELLPDWSPVTDPRRTVWEATQYLVSALGRSESESAELLQRMGGYGDQARQLAYLLFQKASDNGWATEASVYNGLITAWPSLRAADLAVEEPRLW